MFRYVCLVPRLFSGKLVLCRVMGISHKKPIGDQLDQANPVRNDDTGLWQCPFCHKSDFPELSEVCTRPHKGSSQSCDATLSAIDLVTIAVNL